jgi:tRNA-binding EMAP/Myf-like protein
MKQKSRLKKRLDIWIKKAEKHPDADSLCIEEIDIGEAQVLTG